ncbi:SMODS domain-containing nucleotidyltransferase [Haloplanus rubicundus]|uniref:Nucleotidyltransferase n=1 Tax=Haloplanus rubicundus TaxID=1547898 RepID=A0A345E873_9EURY|nr:hypothetical protein [Haloplanus rubicundus]AXG08395.1 hypothetical protein DU484_00190 [Haloplanus rubicundus]
MSTLPSLFETFLTNIRPSDQHIEDYKEGHETLRELLRNDDPITEFYVGDFLQGSYRRWTAVRPIGDEKSDVDIVFVTDLDKDEVTPREAMEKCEPFLEEHYEGQWTRKDRAYEIDQDRIEIDLVLTASPSEAAKAALRPDGSVGGLEVGEGLDTNQSSRVAEAFGLTLDENEEEWRDEPLDIPDRRLEEWDKTHPIATIEWTLKKNDLTDGHYVNVVKAIKWWRRTQIPEPERPKGYPLEHLVGECCPDYIDSVAEGIVCTFETIEQRYANEARMNDTPTLPARGLPQIDVFARIDGDDFAAFHEAAGEAATLAREAYEEDDKSVSRDLWSDLLGDSFPEYGNGDSDDGGEKSVNLDSSSKSTSVSDQRFA